MTTLVKISKYSLIAISYIFFIRFSGIFFGKSLSSNIYSTVFFELLSCLSIFILGMFFLFFTKVYLKETDILFKILSYLLVTSYALVFASHLVNILCVVFNHLFLRKSLTYSFVSSGINSLFLLIFFVYFYLKVKGEKFLKKAILSAAIGSFFYSSLFLTYGFAILRGFSSNREISSPILLILIFWYVTYFNFFANFSKSLDENS